MKRDIHKYIFNCEFSVKNARLISVVNRQLEDCSAICTNYGTLQIVATWPKKENTCQYSEYSIDAYMYDLPEDLRKVYDWADIEKKVRMYFMNAFIEISCGNFAGFDMISFKLNDIEKESIYDATY